LEENVEMQFDVLATIFANTLENVSFSRNY